jgi:murein L,D-transpeptidase YafK
LPTRYLLLVIAAGLATWWLASPASANGPSVVDRVVVDKSDRQLYLMHGQRIVRVYPVSLGRNPTGHKVRRGDQRTPEGRYLLDWRTADSRYYLALHISYPSPVDLQQASRKGFDPGGNIMIHGLPGKYADGARVLLDLDWTDGCIAVSNQAIEEIWQLVADNTIIEIRP